MSTYNNYRTGNPIADAIMVRLCDDAFAWPLFASPSVGKGRRGSAAAFAAVTGCTVEDAEGRLEEIVADVAANNDGQVAPTVFAEAVLRAAGFDALADDAWAEVWS